MTDHPHGTDAFGNPLPPPHSQQPQYGQPQQPYPQQPPPQPASHQYAAPPPMAHQPFAQAPPPVHGHGHVRYHGHAFGGGHHVALGGRHARRAAYKGIKLVISLVTFFILAALGIGAFFLLGDADDIAQNVNNAVQQAQQATGAATGTGNVPSATSNTGSGIGYMDAAKFKRALADVKGEGGANLRVQLLRVDRGQVWVVCGNENFSGTIQVTDSGTNVTNTGAPLTSKLMLDDIDPRAPERIIAAVKKDGNKTSQIDYASVLDFGEPGGRWGMFLKTRGATPAKHYAANGKGRGVKAMN